MKLSKVHSSRYFSGHHIIIRQKCCIALHLNLFYTSHDASQSGTDAIGYVERKWLRKRVTRDGI
jgi:hypothetical protein